jgi:hypothetical protein
MKLRVVVNLEMAGKWGCTGSKNLLMRYHCIYVHVQTSNPNKWDENLAKKLKKRMHPTRR